MNQSNKTAKCSSTFHLMPVPAILVFETEITQIKHTICEAPGTHKPHMQHVQNMVSPSLQLYVYKRAINNN